MFGGLYSGGILRYLLRNRVVNALSAIEPSLSRDETTFMANIAFEDYLNYLKTKHRFSESGKERKFSDFIASMLLRWDESQDKELKDWLVKWLNKWRRRVRLVFAEDEFYKRAGKPDRIPASFLERVQNEVDYIEELRKIIMETLIEKEEYCMMSFITNEIIKNSLIEIRKGIGDEDKAIDFLRKNPLFLLDLSFKYLRNILRKKDALIIIRVDEKLLENFS
ncbi:MAG: hypothetical protein DRJ47_01545 [Thermoprotei archaeon]|nr:MAG: hypothetical protein DRJ47_01545 [Thermoprotei archaeon]